MKIGASTVTAIYLGTTSIVSAYLGSTQVFGGSFTPLSLFSSGAQGIWLDPSDLSTMFSDRAGTTPVVTPGTVVGLRLDKSKGLTLGAELVTNGDFSGGSTGYVEVLNGTISYASQTMSATGTTGNTGVYQDVTVVANRSYQIAWQQISGTDIRVGLYDGASFVTPLYTVSNTITGARSAVVRPTTTTIRVYLSTPAGSTAQFDNISVRELAGNHAAAPTDAARPIYGVEPKGGRRNLLLATEDFSQSAWVKSGVTASAHNVTDPDGGATASTITATGAPGYFYLNTASNPTTGSVLNSLWVRRRTGTGTVALRTNAGTFTDSPITITSSWQRVSVVCTATGAANNCWVLRMETAGDAVDIWHPQLELGSTATAYQRVTTAYDVTESGVATCHYVQYDGSDDSMSTAAIDFTATNKVSVFAGVRKLSDAARAIFVETGTAGTEAGSFGLNAPRDSTRPYLFTAGGTVLVSSQTTDLSFAGTVPRVVTGLADIAGDTNTLRINGTQVAQVTTDQGTGNFGNYSLFIGRRNNATFPFNGKDYGIVIVGKAASAGEITDTETWLAARTAQVTI